MSGQQQSQMDFSHHAAEAANLTLCASYQLQVTVGVFFFFAPRDNVEFLMSQELFGS